MRSILGGILVAIFALPAWAEETPRPNVLSSVSTAPIIHDRDVKPITVFQWDRNGEHHNSFPGDGQTPPYDASKVNLRVYNFPTGVLRRGYYERGGHTPWHPNTNTDIVIYELSAYQVEFVEQQVHYSHPGDVTMHPSNVMHHSETMLPGYRLEFAFKPKENAGHEMIAFSGRDMKLYDATEWVEDNRRGVAYGPTDKKGAKFQVRLFQFPGYLLAELHLPKGETLPVHQNAAEKLFYVAEGKLRVTTDTTTDTVEPGDMVREIAGKPFAREALEDSVLVEIDGSAKPGS